MKDEYILEMGGTPVSVEQIDDNTVAVWHSGLGLTVYGNSLDDALERLYDAIDFLFGLLLNTGGPEAIHARFKKADVKYELKHFRASPGPNTLSLAVTLSRMPMPVGV